MDTKTKDILLFKWMITPVIIQTIFWIGVVLTVVSGVWSMFTVSFIKGLWLVIFGPISMRVACEILIVLFEINDSLTEVNNNIAEVRQFHRNAEKAAEATVKSPKAKKISK